MAHLPKWVPNLLYQSFITSPNDKRDKLIYIARGDAAVNRKVLNEAELIEMLKEMGVEIYFLSKMSIVDQAHLFNSAKLVVASHGGGLTNLAFCEAGTKVLEFFPDNYVNHLFYDICNKRQLDYDYVVCRSQDFTGNDLDRAMANVVADLPAIQNKINKLMLLATD
jgi:capsular polysaccharide biosynthesis protein